jgi:hypothetical protein
MLDLEPRVRLHENRTGVTIHQELERAALVSHRLGRVDDDRAHLAADLLAEHRRRRLLEQLLVTPLNRALALAEMHDRPVLVAENLELDMPGRLDVSSRCRRPDTERRRGLVLRRRDRVASSPAARNPHAAAAAAGRLDDDGKPDLLGQLERLLVVLERAVARAARARRPSSSRGAPAPCRPSADDLGAGADELDVARLAHFSQVRALGQKPWPG